MASVYVPTSVSTCVLFLAPNQWSVISYQLSVISYQWSVISDQMSVFILNPVIKNWLSIPSFAFCRSAELTAEASCLLPVLICSLYSTDLALLPTWSFNPSFWSVISYQWSVISDSVISDQMSVFILNLVIKNWLSIPSFAFCLLPFASPDI